MIEEAEEENTLYRDIVFETVIQQKPSRAHRPLQPAVHSSRRAKHWNDDNRRSQNKDAYETQHGRVGLERRRPARPCGSQNGKSSAALRVGAQGGLVESRNPAAYVADYGLA